MSSCRKYLEAIDELHMLISLKQVELDALEKELEALLGRIKLRQSLKEAEKLLKK